MSERGPGEGTLGAVSGRPVLSHGKGANGSQTGTQGASSAYFSPSLSSLEGSFLPFRSLQSFLVSRFLLASRSGLNSQFAGKRDLNLILGYDDVIDISAYRYEYERGGIARRIVEIFPRATWANGFEIVEDANLKRKTPFEKSVASFYHRLGVQQKLLRASILAYLGHFSIILIGAPGDPETELPQSLSSDNIAYLLPLGEDKAQIVELVGQSSDDDPYDPRYGLPKYYQINLNNPRHNQSSIVTGSQLAMGFSRRVHWSRVIHVVREPLDNEVICSPILESVWNLLHDLKKLTGGLSEAALRKGWPGLHANVAKDAKFDGGANSPELQGIKSQLDDYNIGLGNAITTRGVDLTSLGTQGSIQIKDNADAIIEQIAATIGAPMRLFRGAELGQANSLHDRDNFSDRVMEIRESHNTPVVRQLNNRLVKYGYLPPPRNPNWDIVYPEEEEMSEKEKAEVAVLLSKSGALTDDEIRDRLWGMAPREVMTETIAPSEDSST